MLFDIGLYNNAKQKRCECLGLDLNFANCMRSWSWSRSCQLRSWSWSRSCQLRSWSRSCYLRSWSWSCEKRSWSPHCLPYFLHTVVCRKQHVFLHNISANLQSIRYQSGDWYLGFDLWFSVIKHGSLWICVLQCNQIA